MIGHVITLGFGGGLGLLPTIGYRAGVGAVQAPTHHGGDDEVDHEPDKRLLRLARLRQEDEAVLRMIVSFVTELQ